MQFCISVFGMGVLAGPGTRSDPPHQFDATSKNAMAAMDFLLESYRKHRRWVWLKQALLLLSRMAAMALLVAMLAQWISGSSWIALFGESVTHHYIVLDDSFSMSDTSQGTSAYQRGIGAIGAILRSAASQGGAHQVTLIRASRAQSNPGSSDVKADLAADLLARSLPPIPFRCSIASPQPNPRLSILPAKQPCS